MSITSLKKKAPSKQENVLERKRQFKGVRKRKGGKKWVSEVRVPNSRERIWLGSYDTPEEAARAYEYAVSCFRGTKAKLNLPDFSPQNVLAPSCPPEEIQAAAAKYAVEGFRQPSHKDAAFDGNESQSWQLILEEEDPALLDSLLQEFESGESTNVDDLSGQHAPTHDPDFLVLEEQDLLEFQTHPNSLNVIFRLH